MNAIRSLLLAICAMTLATGSAFGQPADLRKPLPQPLKIKQGMLNVPALSPLWLLPDEAAKYNIQIEMVMFLKNVSIAGGFLLLVANGAGRLSLDRRLAR